METKKYEKVKIENYSGIFFQLGLVLALLIIYVSLEYQVQERSINELVGTINQEEIVEDIPITERLEILKPPPPPPLAPETIEIVEDISDIEESVLESTETDQGDAVETFEISEINEVVEEESVVEDVPFAIVEEAPIYPGCKGSKDIRRKCFEEKIKEHVGKNFNSGLAQELGLETGKNRVYVLFKIDHNGNVVNVQSRGPHVRLEKEANRVVELLPKMIPAKQRGRSVGIKYTIPITFQII